MERMLVTFLLLILINIQLLASNVGLVIEHNGQNAKVQKLLLLAILMLSEYLTNRCPF